MDRGNRPLLIWLGAAVCLLGAPVLRAQTPTPAPPTPKPTPWVQASPPPASPTPKPAASPKPTPPADDVKAKMIRRRSEEIQHVEQLTPEERATYEQNLKLWRELPQEERQTLRNQAGERVRAEIDKAYQDSGLALTEDQREVFALRYRQERRRMERDILNRVATERSRRMPEIIERLKREFGKPPAPPSPPPSTPPPSPTPAASVGPTPLPPGFMR